MPKGKVKEISEEEFKQYRRSPGIYGLSSCVEMLRNKVNELVKAVNEMKK